MNLRVLSTPIKACYKIQKFLALGYFRIDVKFSIEQKTLCYTRPKKCVVVSAEEKKSNENG